MDMQEARARVARGAALLDEKRPGWAELIKTNTLNMQHNCFCVLGQLEGSFSRAVAAWFGEEAFDGPIAASYGFTVEEDELEYIERQTDWNNMQAAWIEAITERLTPPVSWTHRDTVAAVGVERCERAEAVRP